MFNLFFFKKNHFFPRASKNVIDFVFYLRDAGLRTVRVVVVVVVRGKAVCQVLFTESLYFGFTNSLWCGVRRQ